MTVPTFQELTLPVLRACASGEAKIGEVVDRLSKNLNLSESDRSELLPSGRQTKFANRVHWAKTYLAKAGLVELTGRGLFSISDDGRSVLANPPSKIDIKFLERFPKFNEFREGGEEDDNSKAGKYVHAVTEPQSTLTPDDRMRAAQQELQDELAADLLSRIVVAPPDFFERLVVRLLVAMGYGGSTADAARALGKSGDGGVDGVIDQDALGLDRIYVQAKRYAVDNSVGAAPIRDFFGSLDRFKAAKGLFVTTSSFTVAARETAEFLSKRIVPIDGRQLTKLMIRHGVGCRVEETLYIHRVDEEFFE